MLQVYKGYFQVLGATKILRHYKATHMWKGTSLQSHKLYYYINHIQVIPPML